MMRRIYTPPWLQEIREYWLQLCLRVEQPACHKPASNQAPDNAKAPLNTPTSNRASPGAGTHVSLPPICSDECDDSS